jgi:VWFA-related protein
LSDRGPLARATRWKSRWFITRDLRGVKKRTCEQRACTISRNLQISNRFIAQRRLTLFGSGTYTDVMPERRAIHAFVVAATIAAGAALHAQSTPRAMYVSVLDEAGAPVPDLGPSDFVVTEDGVAREVLAVSPADDPLQIEILIDNSEAAQDYIADIRRALPPFVDALLGPDARRNQIGLVALADRPTILTQSTSNAAELKKGIDRLFPLNGAGTYLLDGLIEVGNGFRKRGAARPVIVAITTEGPEFSSPHFERVLASLRDSGAAFHAIVVGRPASDTTSDEARTRSIVLDRGPRDTGGRLEHVLTSMAIDAKLMQLANELTHQYRVTFSRPEALIPPETTSVGVKQPGLTARGTLIRATGRP